jgi:hypothetical protein
VFGVVYLIALVKHPPPSHGLRAISFFTESTKLFPSADLFALDFRLDGYSCWGRRWEPIDPRAYFPIQADDKESRFQRFSYFYQGNRESMHALEAYIEGLHPTRLDGLFGPIGGIRLSKWTHPIPPPGAEVARYVYRPLEIPPRTERKDLYYTRESEIRKRCVP